MDLRDTAQLNTGTPLLPAGSTRLFFPLTQPFFHVIYKHLGKEHFNRSQFTHFLQQLIVIAPFCLSLSSMTGICVVPGQLGRQSALLQAAGSLSSTPSFAWTSINSIWAAG